ncbi:MAG: Mth938-like domain-containing protein [Pseudomonadota bacterium]
MDITPTVSADRQLVQGYGDLGFTISGQRHEGPVLVLPDRTLAWTGELSAEALAPAMDAGIEILLIGCGRGMMPLPRELKAALRAAGIVAEPMDTGAACRTYNVLLTEDRRVAAALVAV